MNCNQQQSVLVGGGFQIFASTPLLIGIVVYTMNRFDILFRSGSHIGSDWVDVFIIMSEIKLSATQRFLTQSTCVRLFFCLILIYFCGCSKTDSPARTVNSLKTVRVGFIPTSICLPFFVAEDNGMFVKHGLNIKAVRFNDSTQALNALIAGQVDALAGITFSSYWAAEQEESGGLKLFLRSYETPSDPFSFLLARKDSDIKNVQDLRGKKIGTYSGVSQLLYLRLFLKKIGLDPSKDVTIIQVGADLQIQALAADQYDALFTVEPYGTICIYKGGGRVVVASPRTLYIQNPFWGGAAAVTTRYLKNNKKTVEMLYEGMADGVRSIRQQPENAKAVLPKYTPIDAEIAGKSGIYQWVLLNENFPTDGIQSLADTMFMEGVLRKQIDAIAMMIRSEDLSTP